MNFNKEMKTIKTYTYWYAKFISFNDCSRFIEFCKENYSISTQKIIISSIKHFESNDFANSLRMPKGTSGVVESTISSDEYKMILDNLVYTNFVVSQRNRKIIEVLWNTGMRIGELLNLKWKDYSNKCLRVKGKGNKIRTIPIHHKILSDFCVGRQTREEYIFKNTHGGNMSYSSIVKLFKRIKVLLNRDDVSAHVMRHSFATRLLKKDVPILYISKLMGHSNISITERYMHWNNNDIRKILEEKDWLC